MTVPGVGLVTATAFLAQVGEITRFPNPNRLVSYLGLDPTRAPIRRQRRAHRPDLEGGLRARPARPRRSRPDRDPQPRPAARVLRTRPRPPRPRRSRSSPSPASSPCCSGTCSSADRTTPTRCRPRPPRSSARSSSKPARPPAEAAAPTRPQPRRTTQARAPLSRTRRSRLPTQHRRLATPTEEGRPRSDLTFIRPFAISFSA